MQATADEAWSGYRRLIRIVPRLWRIDVDMEDDAHCFGVTVFHDGVRIARIETRETRHPWTMCPMAAAFLRERMQGVLLADAPYVEDQRQHCTHVYDLFVLAVRHATDNEDMTYAIRVGDRDADGRKFAEIECNGALVLTYPDAQDMRGMAAWSFKLPDAMQEAARMLRRGAMVAQGRGLTFPEGKTAAALMGRMSGACFTFQPERAALAERISDSVRDFSETPEKMLSGELNDQRSGGLLRP